ncbi:hypothetical protein [Streptomyces sp. Tue6028]|uniref:hypothetical protein n=1 Tax=Streptomyces sp. Tue6028 TaxID=2036037 RepID=UPI003EC0FDAE
METRKAPHPEHASDAQEFVALLRQVKESCGFTYRELEQRAAARGEVLARSTLANALARDVLPRPELVVAFVRACATGNQSESEAWVDRWLTARERIALRETTAESGGEPAEEAVGDEGVLGRSRRRGWRFVAVGAAVTALTLAAWILAPTGPDTGKQGGGRGSERRSDADTAAAIPSGPVRVRPVQSPTLCLTDGFVQDGRYTSQVAVHRACLRATPPVTDLVPAGGGTYRIRWRHPVQGTGCLKALTSGPARGLLEPRDACAAATRFRIQLVPGNDGESPAFVFRLDAGRCVTAARPTPQEGTEATFRSCDGGRDEQYLISST